MTFRAFLLVGSVALNAAILAAVALRPSLAPVAVRDFVGRHLHFHDHVAASPLVKPPVPAPRKKIGLAFESGGDLTALVARLRAAGFPPGIIREMVRSEVNARYNPRIRALSDSDPNTPFWKQSSLGASTSKRYEEIAQLERERSKLLRELFSDTFFATDDVSATQRRQFGNLTRQKIDLVQRIEDDYAEMTSAIRGAMAGITLPEDRDKLALLAREKHADLATVLTAEEIADYELRSSPITSLMRGQLGGFEPSEAEFRALFQYQQALNEKFPTAPGGSIDMQRGAAQQQLNAELKTALGDARYADYVRETSNEFRQLASLAQRENLPPETSMRAYTFRDSIVQESNRIFDDAALNIEQKRSALQSLAQNTRAQLLAILGPNAGEAYIKIANAQWLLSMERGSAVTFNGGPNMTITNTSATVSLGVGPVFRSLPRTNPPPRS